MDGKAYNVYLKMVKFGCENVRAEICRINFFNGDEVTVKVRGTESLVALAEKIAKHPQTAVAVYSDEVDKRLVVRSTEPTVKMKSASGIFIESVISSQKARDASLKLVDLHASLKFLHDGYVYDVKFPPAAGVDGALEKAKAYISGTHSLSFLSMFDFLPTGPAINEVVAKELELTACNERFSHTTMADIERVAVNKYTELFASRTSLFSQTDNNVKNAVKLETVKKKMNTVKMHSKVTPITSKTISLDVLFSGTLSEIPLNGKKRILTNLKSRQNAVLIMPEYILPSKRQRAKIEYMSNHKYIMDYYADTIKKAGNTMSVAQHLFREENRMYKFMWGSVQSVHFERGRLIFPDGSNIIVPKGQAPHEFFHKVNAVYAALFGYTSADARSGDDWVYNSIRKAYTEEGMADYVLALIDARMSGKLKPDFTANASTG